MWYRGHRTGVDVPPGHEVLSNERAHTDVVTDMQLSADGSCFITSNKRQDDAFSIAVNACLV